MTEQEPPKIEFPCEYPIKVLGRSTEQFQGVILEVFESHAPGFDRESIVVKASGKGTFTSLTITITATGKEQLQALHQDLMATGQVQMVINTTEGAQAIEDSFSIRRSTLVHNVAYYTTITAAKAASDAIVAMRDDSLDVAPLQSYFTSEF